MAYLLDGLGSPSYSILGNGFIKVQQHASRQRPGCCILRRGSWRKRRQPGRIARCDLSRVEPTFRQLLPARLQQLENRLSLLNRRLPRSAKQESVVRAVGIARAPFAEDSERQRASGFYEDGFVEPSEGGERRIGPHP